MTRLWPAGVPIDMRLGRSGAPEAFVWQGERHVVTAVVTRWRVSVDWWRTPTQRDYYKLTTASGLLVIVYHDLAGEDWFLQRLFD